MSWQELKPKLGKAADNHGVRVSMAQFFTITIGTDVAERLGWKARENVKLMLGKDEHAGTLRVARDTSAFGRRNFYMLLPGSKGAATLKLRMRQFPGAAPGTHDIERVPYTIAGTCLDITLPEWAAPRVREPVSPIPQPRQATVTPAAPGESFIKPLTREQLMRGRA